MNYPIELADGPLPDDLIYFYELDDTGIVRRHEFRGTLAAPLGKSGFDLVGEGVAVYQARAYLDVRNALAAAWKIRDDAIAYARRVTDNVIGSFDAAGVDLREFLRSQIKTEIHSPAGETKPAADAA